MQIQVIILALVFIFAPAGVLWLCSKSKFLGSIGPILILYIAGVIIGNLPWINEGTAGLKDAVTTAMIPLAIPMMMFGCAFTMKDMKGVLRSLLAGLIAILLTIFCGYAIFGKHLGPEGAAIAGMLTGCETGGTINMSSLQLALGVEPETFVLLNTYDMVICFFYFIFLLGGGIKLFRKILPVEKTVFTKQDELEVQQQIEKNNANPYKGLWSKKGMAQIGMILVAVAIVCGLGFLTTRLFPKTWFMPVFILMITTLSLIGSYLKPIKKLDKSYDIGMYCIYIFSIAMASMADLSSLSLQTGLYAFLFLLFIIFGSLFIQLLFSKIFKVDADMMIVSSVALINSPPFVPLVVTAMKNKKVLLPGITVGIIGFALGNYLGLLFARILPVIFPF